MKKPHILFLPYKLHFRYFLFALAKRNSVTVLLPPEKSLPQQTDLRGVRINYRQFGTDKIKRLIGKEIRTQKYVDGLSSILEEQKPDVLISCEFYHWYTLQSLAYKKRNPSLQLFVVSETKRWPKNPIAYVIKRVVFLYFRRHYSQIDAMLVYTTQAQEFLAQHMPHMKTILVPAPIDTDLFVPQPEKVYYPNETLRLLFNARYSPYKRHKDLFEAIARLRANGRTIALTCISRDNKRLDEIQHLAREYGVEQMVQFIDAMPLSEMPALAHAHDVSVLPSYNEAIGLVVPEAMACGLPTITSDTVGGNVYVKDGVTGFIFKTGDVDGLTRAIKTCCDAQLLSRMGQQARARIVEEFTAEKVIQELENNIHT